MAPGQLCLAPSTPAVGCSPNPPGIRLYTRVPYDNAPCVEPAHREGGGGVLHPAVMSPQPPLCVGASLRGPHGAEALHGTSASSTGNPAADEEGGEEEEEETDTACPGDSASFHTPGSETAATTSRGQKADPSATAEPDDEGGRPPESRPPAERPATGSAGCGTATPPRQPLPPTSLSPSSASSSSSSTTSSASSSSYSPPPPPSPSPGERLLRCANVLNTALSFLSLVERWQCRAVCATLSTACTGWAWGPTRVTPQTLLPDGDTSLQRASTVPATWVSDYVAQAPPPPPQPAGSTRRASRLVSSALISFLNSSRPVETLSLTSLGLPLEGEGGADLSRDLLTPLLVSSPTTLRELSLAGMSLGALRGPLSPPPGVAPLPPAAALSTLRLIGCPETSQGALGTLLELCPNLTELDLRGCPEGEVVSALLGAKPRWRLRRLSIGWSTEFAALVDGCLELKFCESPGVGAAVSRIASECSDTLEQIATPGFVWLNQEAVASLGGCRSLRSINLSNCRRVNDTAALDLLRGNPALVEANFRATSIGNAAAKQLARCRGLRQLNLSCTRVGDAGLAAVAEGCPSLTHLDLCYLSGGGVSPGAVLRAVRASGQCLRLLGLGGHTTMSDAVLDEVMEACPFLETLGIGGCIGLTSGVWALVAQRLPLLRVLLAHGLGVVTQRGVERLVEGCPKLAMLDLLKVKPNAELSQEQIAALQAQYPMDWHAFQ